MKSLIIRFKPLYNKDSRISFEVSVGDFRKKFCGEVLGLNSFLSINYGVFSIEKQINMAAKSVSKNFSIIEHHKFANQIKKSHLNSMLRKLKKALIKLNLSGCSIIGLRNLLCQKKYLSKVNYIDTINFTPNIDINKNYVSDYYNLIININKGISLKAQNNDSLKFLSKIATSVKIFLSGLLFCRSKIF